MGFEWRVLKQGFFPSLERKSLGHLSLFPVFPWPPGDTWEVAAFCAAGKHYNPNGARILITSCITDAEARWDEGRFR